MTEFLAFTLYAPFSSWGDITVGEERTSWDRPSRSAILGLIAAGLGLRRDTVSEHRDLDEAIGLAVRVDARGAPLTDYHTAQTASASQVRTRRPRTRAELLRSRDLETMLSRRAYRQDAVATIVLWAAASSRWSLSDVANALRRPHFVLYAGRKANSLGLPLDPVVVEAPTLADALGQFSLAASKVARFLTPPLTFDKSPEVAWDADRGVVSGLVESRREIRRDASPDRARWQFAERTVCVSTFAGAEGGTP